MTVTYNELETLQLIKSTWFDGLITKKKKQSCSESRNRCSSNPNLKLKYTVGRPIAVKNRRLPSFTHDRINNLPRIMREACHLFIAYYQAQSILVYPDPEKELRHPFHESDGQHF